ncbi:MAG TPA: hypothetical protein VGB84_08855 [Arachidicoccus sp.]
MDNKKAQGYYICVSNITTMSSKIILISAICLTLFACKEKQNSTATEEKAKAAPPQRNADTTQTHFSIKSYLADQWSMRKNDPYTILEIVDNNGNADSSFLPLDSALWVTMFQPFYAADIGEPKYQGWYKIATYADETTETNHLNYEAVSPDYFTQKMDLAVNPVSSDVKAVYIETSEKKDGRTLSNKLQYRTGDIVQIISFEKEKDKPGITTKTEYRFKY